MEPGQRQCVDPACAFIGTPNQGKCVSCDLAAVEAACVPAMPADVTALVERLEGQLGRTIQYEGNHVAVMRSSDLRDLLSAIKAQAEKIERLTEGRDMMGNWWAREKARAEAAEAKLREAVALLCTYKDEDATIRAFLSTMETRDE